jgi:hypothetical protein
MIDTALAEKRDEHFAHAFFAQATMSGMWVLAHRVLRI